MDRAEPRQALEGASAPTPPVAEEVAGNSDAAAVQPDGQRALPAPQQPDRPRGRHEALRRRSVGGPAGAAIAVVIASVAFAGVLATWLISSAKEPGGPAKAASTSPAGPTSRPPGPSAFGNLVVNWSFEEDLSGWQVLGAADVSQEPQGRTSGSCASIRARGPEPSRVGLALPEVVPSAKPGQRYVASAWVRSTAPGQPVTIRLVGAGGKESSKTTATTLPGLEWRRVIVAHTVATAGPLRLEIAAEPIPAGDSLLVDEVVVRTG
ncbi:MAG TPA: carbohydrate binding domain-containing protein [Actinomycetota bacterium]|nr:carbohydrate binding domain-containing protein [Actinomycetota bacterium]